MQGSLDTVDILVLLLYGGVLIGMGLYYKRKCRTAEEFMVAGRSIPAWAAGLAVMSTYTSSISYIATPGKAYSSNWHPFIFALCIVPVAWFVCRYAVPYYRRMKLISVYEFLEDRLGSWARIYGALSFVLYMVGRIAVILYLASLLLNTFIPCNIVLVIVVLGLITIVYTFLGGMEAVIWTDVMQSMVMIVGIIFCAVILTRDVFSQPEYLIQAAFDADKFSLGSAKLTLDSQQHLGDRTIWVMIIFGITENLRSLIADQNCVQKYSSVADERQAKRSIWIGMLIYIPSDSHLPLYRDGVICVLLSRRPPAGRRHYQRLRSLSVLHCPAIARRAQRPGGRGDPGGGHEHRGFQPELFSHGSAP